jgi:hypothetical protein
LCSVEGVARSEVANSVSVSALVRGCSSRANFAHHVDAGWVKVIGCVVMLT